MFHLLHGAISLRCCWRWLNLLPKGAWLSSTNALKLVDGASGASFMNPSNKTSFVFLYHLKWLEQYLSYHLYVCKRSCEGTSSKSFIQGMTFKRELPQLQNCGGWEPFYRHHDFVWWKILFRLRNLLGLPRSEFSYQGAIHRVITNGIPIVTGFFLPRLFQWSNRFTITKLKSNIIWLYVYVSVYVCTSIDWRYFFTNNSNILYKDFFIFQNIPKLDVRWCESHTGLCIMP